MTSVGERKDRSNAYGMVLLPIKFGNNRAKFRELQGEMVL